MKSINKYLLIIIVYYGTNFMLIFNLNILINILNKCILLINLFFCLEYF